jgi:hypothetical protein
LIELHSLHCKLLLIRPDNYGTLSAFILQLMRAVMVTPSNIPSYVQSAMRILHQSRIMERFGMFFIDDLDPDDMERIDVNLGVQDGAEIKRVHSAALATRNPPKKSQGRGMQLTEPYKTADYPWGETITWRTLQRLCKDHPVDFLRRFDFYEEVSVGSEPLDLIIETLFIAFTRETWLGLHESFVPAGVRPQPDSLKDSMEVWTCQNILARLGGKCTFLPSTYGLEGAPKSKTSDLSSSALRLLFFPDPDQNFKANAIWVGYTEQNGYIRRYWDILEMYRDDPGVVNDRIENVIAHVQCLPQSKADSNLWHAIGGSVCFLINPHYYRIRAVSTASRAVKLGPQRPQVSKAELRTRLNPHNSTSKKRKRNSSNKQSIKKKNYRQPPKKRKRKDDLLPAQAGPSTRTGRRSQTNAQKAAEESQGPDSDDSETTDSSSSSLAGVNDGNGHDIDDDSDSTESSSDSCTE